jgi:hypothetical protein
MQTSVIEATITNRIERRLGEAEGIRLIESHTVTGVSVVRVYFHRDVEPGLALAQVRALAQGAFAGVEGKCRVLPGIDIGIPTGPRSRKASPDDTYAAVAAALKAGADGVVLSRKYSEMRLDNLAAAGRAVRDCLG